MDRQAFKQRMQNLKSYRENNPGKGYWDFKQQQAPGPYSAGELVKSIEEFTNHEEYLGPPSHNYDFTLSEEWADKHGYYPDERGHRDDRVKKEAHPTHPSKGEWKSQYQFDLTDKGIEDPNFILYGLNDGGQDPQATMTYRGGIVLPELTVTPKGNYIYNSYDNIKAYWPGGETGESEKERFYQATGRSSSGRPLEEGLKPVFSLEDAANMTPIGDAISARDTYNAVKNRDWLGAGLAAVTMIPFVPTTVRNFRKKYKGVTPKREIPTVNKKAIDNAIDEAKNYRDSRIKLYQQAIEDRNASYERLIENEDALRRAVNFDKKYGTNYVKTYTKQLQNYAKSKNSPDLMQIGIKPMGANGSFDPNIPDYVFINSDYVKNGKLQPGLISHEKSHYDNQKAGALSLPIFDNRFVDTKKTKTMYPKTYDWIQRYLHNFEETKSHMNEFRTNMINKNLLKPDSKVGLKQIKDLIFNSDNDNMKKLFNTYKSKRQFVKDFNSVPITSIGDNKTLV